MCAKKGDSLTDLCYMLMCNFCSLKLKYSDILLKYTGYSNSMILFFSIIGLTFSFDVPPTANFLWVVFLNPSIKYLDPYLLIKRKCKVIHFFIYIAMLIVLHVLDKIEIQPGSETTFYPHIQQLLLMLPLDCMVGFHSFQAEIMWCDLSFWAAGRLIIESQCNCLPAEALGNGRCGQWYYYLQFFIVTQGKGSEAIFRSPSL